MHICVGLNQENIDTWSKFKTLSLINKITQILQSKEWVAKYNFLEHWLVKCLEHEAIKNPIHPKKIWSRNFNSIKWTKITRAE